MVVGAPTPPHSLDAERAVLGALLLSGDQLMPAVQLDERLVADDFYREQHSQVFAAMVVLYDENRPIDEITVAKQMTAMGVVMEDAPRLLDDLTGHVPAAGHVREYARIVRAASLRRRLLTATYEVQAGVMDNTPLEVLLERSEQDLFAISDATVSELLALKPDDELARLAQIRDGVPVVGLGTGFKDLDDATSGLQPGNLIVLAARPSMGKSALVTNLAENVAAKGTAVALFSLEMSRGEILRRLLASRASVSGDTLLRGPIPPNQWARVQSAVTEVAGWPLYVDEGVDAGVLDVRAKARRLAKRVKLGLVIVDYVQLMRADSHAENRNIEVGKITRGLKLLAKELAVPVIAVSQLSRALETRSDKRPVLSDLRDSGNIEQDADLVAFLYRDSYYNDEAEEPEVTELNIAKHRNGPLAKIKLVFLEKYPKFGSYTKVDVGVEAQALRYGRTTEGEEMAF